MKTSVNLAMLCGRKDNSPRKVDGEICIHKRTVGGQELRVMILVDKNSETPVQAELWEPTVMSWVDHMVTWRGWENNYGQWSMQIWRCEFQR